MFKRYFLYIREQLFPIGQEERARVIALCVYKALASFVYVILKTLKDVLVMKHKGEEAGLASITCCIKGTLALPISLVFVGIYTYLIHRYPPRRVFYGIICFFIGFLLLYTTFLLPQASHLKLSRDIARWLPFFMQDQHWVLMFQYWMHTLFYIIAFLWAQVMIVLLFFSLCNELFSFHVAKRVYHLLLTAGYVGGLLATRLNIWLIPSRNFKDSSEMLQTTITHMLTAAIIAGAMLLLFYLFLDYYFLQPVEFKKLSTKTLSKEKIGFWISIKQVSTNRALFAVLILVLSANITNSLTEVVYKQNMANDKVSGLAFLGFCSQVLEYSIVISILTGLFVSGNIIRKWGWRFSAYVTPITVLLGGSLFLLANAYPYTAKFLGEKLHIGELELFLIIGTLQHLLWKITQYMFFDLTKEMSYIQMDLHTRRKGKAAVDLLGNPLGHLVGSWILLGPLAWQGTSNVLMIAKPILIFFILICIPWLYSVHYLGNLLSSNNGIKAKVN